MRTICLIGLAALGAVGSVTPGLAQEVGVTAAVNPAVEGTPPSEKPHTLTLGDKVIHNEQIATDAKGLLQILLADGSSFTVGPNSKLSIDSFVYDPSAGTAQVTATLSKGLFRFIGGKASKSPDGVSLNTPVGTVGIRGGIADLDLGGPNGSHIDMRFGDSVTLTDGGKQLGWVFQNGYSIVIGANDQVSVEKTPPAWTAAMQAYLSSKSGQNGGAGKSTTTGGITASGTNRGNNPSTPNTNPQDNNQPPGTWSNDGVRVATWDEINNSSLADVTAKYKGTAVGTVTSGDSEYDATGKFSLKYSFARRSGDLSIYDFDGHDLDSHVHATSDGGLAEFRGWIHGNHWECGWECDIRGKTSGLFVDQGSNIGSAVVGQFQATDGDDWSATGAFTGDLTKTYSHSHGSE